MADVKKFKIRGKGLLAGTCEEMDFLADRLVMRQPAQCCGYLSKLLDSGEAGTEWGRIVLDCKLPEESECAVYALALDYDIIEHEGKEVSLAEFVKAGDIPFLEKLETLKLAGAQVGSNAQDILLFNQKGRFLVFGIRVFSSAPAEFLGFDVTFPKETLMQYLPEVYTTEGGDFFERFMTIFGSIIYDKKEQLGTLPDYLDLDKAPDEILPMFAQWLGINCDVGFLKANQMRRLLKKARELSAYKGTKQVLEDVAEIYLGERPVIVEQFKWRQYSGVRQQVSCKNLYGTKNNEFTILLKNKLTEGDFLNLKNLIDIFTPLKSRAKIVCLSRESLLDQYTYMDINAKLTGRFTKAASDKGQTLDSEFALG